MAAVRVLIFGVLLIALMPSRARADFSPASVTGEPVTVSGSLRMREEVWNWFDPGTTANRQNDNRYHFFGGYIRLGAAYQMEGVKIFAELMTPFLINLPDDAIAPAPQGLLGFGGNYFQPNQSSNSASVFLKQGYLEFGQRAVQGLDFKGGRFEFADGSEFVPSDPELKWLAKNRIAQRLVGNFGFSDVMRSFDGAVASYGDRAWQATVMYGVPTKGAFDLQGMNEIRNTDLVYASLNAGPNRYWGNSLARIFYIYYDDGRGLVPVDNRSAAVRNSDRRPIDIHTVGVDYVGTIAAGPGVADLLLWGGGQLGTWGRLTHEAYFAAAEAGYRLVDLGWKPWLRLGYTTTSGDGNSRDHTHETFFQILPTPRPYAMFPFFNMMNLDDAMLQMVLTPVPDAEVQSALHGLWLSSTRDLWYAGGGEFDDKLFGYAGRPSSGRSYLATLLDCQVTWKLNEHLSSAIYYAHAFGGSVVSAIYPAGKAADYGFIEATLSF